MTLVALYKKELGETLFNFRGGSWLLLVAVIILSVVSLLSVTIDKFNLVDQKHIRLRACARRLSAHELDAVAEALKPESSN